MVSIEQLKELLEACKLNRTPIRQVRMGESLPDGVTFELVVGKEIYPLVVPTVFFKQEQEGNEH